MMHLTASLLALVLASGSVLAQEKSSDVEPASGDSEKMRKQIESFGWTRSGKGRLGSWSEIEIPNGYRFTGSSGASKMMKLMGNIPDSSLLGMIAPEGLDWFVLFEFEDSGYVKDTDKDQLDADAILKTLKAAQAEGNKAREEQGLEKLELLGWSMPPKYNSETHNLEWGIRVASESGGETINYLTKLLGRRGVMHVTLLVSPQELNAVLPDYQKLIAGHRYQSGQTYAEYRQGDKVAQYTLAGLITAGAGVALLKSGWLAKLGVIFLKLGKAAWLLVVAALAAVKRAFSAIFGRRSQT